MICIYSSDNTNYSNNGDAVLIPISCTLTMTINGAWQLDLEHPYDAEERYKLIQEGAVIRADIKCVGEQSTIRQRFRIYTYNRGVNSVTCIAFPIAMEATFDAPIDNLVLENKTASEAAAQLQALTQKYSIETNVTGTKSASYANTNINSALASGDDGCFIQVWGGEVVYDNLKFNIRSRIGSDTGYKIQYGHNMTGIDYSKDDSGLSTRVHPISEDGIRLNGTGYVDSPLIDNYPIHHDRYMITPYRLVDTEEASPSRTAQETRACVSAVTSATTTLSQSSYAAALGAGYQPDYIKTISSDIITAVQNMALANVISTDLYKLLSDTIKNAMAWLADLTQPEWGWMGSYETGWRYGDTNGYAKDMYVRIGKTWSYFGSQGYWEEPKDDKEEWNWHQKEGEGRRYGNFNKYFAHNTFVYITMDGTLQEYWMNEEGWYEADESGESEWSWHGSGTSEDPYWFGEEGATSEDPKKYAHDTWLFIDGAYYFFDSYGYYAPNTAILDYQWDWVQDDERWWFGNAINREFAAVYVESQWLKINGTWYYFDEDGYVVDQDSSRSDAIAVFTTGMASLLTTVNTRKDALYTLLYALMTEWVNKKYAEGIDKPALTVTVSMVDLSRTTEYANFVALETIKLGDSVEIDDTEHGIHTTGSRVIGLTYDVIRGYNSNVVIGKPQATVSSMLSQANGQAVAGGFDTSAIEAQIDALQDRVSDVRYNGRSLLQGTIAILDSIGGTSINYGTSTPTGGSDGDVYFQTDSNGNVVKIWQNHSGVWGSMEDGGLKYFVETETTLTGHEDASLSIQDDINHSFDHTYSATIDLRTVSGKSKNIFTVETVNGGHIITGYDRSIKIIGIYSTSSNEDGIFVIGETQEDVGFKVTNQYNGNVWNFTYNTTEQAFPSNVFEGISGAISGTFRYNNKTYYISFIYTDWGWIDDIASTFRIVPKYRQGSIVYQSLADMGQKILALTASGNLYSGMAQHDRLAFFAGAFSQDGEDGQIRIYNDGTVVGLPTEEEVKSKQDKLIAGQNITIGADGKTISATDTDALADLTDVEFSNLTNGQVLKYDATNQKWINSTGGGGGSEVIPNPQDEPTDTLNTVEIDGTVYDIEGGGGGSNLIIDARKYSLEEQVVGIWIDGKPLYELTLNCGQAPNNGTANYNLPSNSYDYIMITEGCLYNPTTKVSLPLNLVHTETSSYSNGCFLAMEQNQIRVMDAFDRSAFNVYVTIQYTKTTDTAGSGGYQAYGFSPIIYSDVEREIGVWRDNKPLYAKTVTTGGSVPSGATLIHREALEGYDCIYYTNLADVAGSGEYNTLAIPNVHYSTDEQVIGTWIDGKTLYQKTFTLASGSLSTGRLDIPNDLGRVDTIVDSKCVLYNETLSRSYFIPYMRTTDNESIYLSIMVGSSKTVTSYLFVRSSSYASQTYSSLSNITLTLQYTKA